MIKERVITILAWSNIRLPKLEEMTGISRYTWSNLKNPSKAREIKEDEILAIAKVFPQFRWWLLTGEVMPEIGQTSPEMDEANSTANEREAG
ncbi:TPA: XRE family transcriptional regulator [Pseudomonas aeruginosa]|nr:XRE family transcriptional regulator [Pseudomonas aeruginosa]